MPATNLSGLSDSRSPASRRAAWEEGYEAMMRVMIPVRSDQSGFGTKSPRVSGRRQAKVVLATAALALLFTSSLLVSCGTSRLAVPRGGCAIAFPVASQQPNVDALVSGAWASEVCGQVGGIAGAVTGAPTVATTIPPGSKVICSVQKPTFLSSGGRVGYGAATPGQSTRLTKYLRVQIFDSRSSRGDQEACGEVHTGNLPF
jgi:hypothetical protein